jgi:hypothetical protein
VSWEKTDEWPDGRTEGGAFRAAAEVIVARREAPTLRDRVRLWWHSTPDHPFGAIARRVVLTPGWLYCETRAGGRQRVHASQLRGSRREAGRVIYAIADGDDLVIADRGGDALERALDEKVGTTGEWRSPSAFVPVFIFSAIALAISLFATFQYRDEAIDRIERGLTTAESALGLYAGLGGVLLVLLFITFFPQRWIADSLGLTSVRGLFGWVRSTVPVERISGVIVDRFTTRNNKSGNTFTHHYVDLLLLEPMETKRLFLAGSATGDKLAAKREIARQIGRRVASLYEVDLQDRLG